MSNKNTTVQATSGTEAGRFAKCISALREVEIAAASASDLSAIFQVLLKNIEGFLPYADSATVALLLDAASGQFEPLASRNVPKGAEEQCKRAWAASAEEVLKAGATLTIDDLQANNRTLDDDYFKEHGWVSRLGIPLIADGQGLGAILAYTRSAYHFAREDPEIFSAFGAQAVAAIRHLRVYEDNRKRLAELESENRLKDQFLKAISSELRTPLTSVMGHAAMIQDGMLGELNPRQETALAAVMKSCQDQLRLVNGVLELVKTEGLKEQVLQGSRALTEAVEEFERELISKALEKTGFNQTKAAKLLGITRRILQYKMEKLNLPKAP